MKSTVTNVLAAGLLLSGISLMQAQTQTPSHLMRIFREDIKEGKGAAHERVESAYARTFAKSAYPNYIAYEDVTGISQVWFVERYDTYEAMEKAIQLAEKEPLKSMLAPLDVQDGELRTGGRGIIATYQPDMSYVPVPPTLSKNRYLSINIVRIRPGHSADFTEMRKLLYAAYEKSGQKQRRVVYSVTSGMPGGTYLVLSGMESLKSLDPPPNPMTMADAFGATLERYNHLQSDIVVSSENTLFSVNTKMSNPPKEYAKENPDFWAPKPFAPAVAAKPAAKTGAQQ